MIHFEGNLKSGVYPMVILVVALWLIHTKTMRFHKNVFILEIDYICKRYAPPIHHL